MPRPNEIQAIIDFTRGLERRFGAKAALRRRSSFGVRDTAAFAVQAGFSAAYLEEAYPLADSPAVATDVAVDLWRWPVVGGPQRISVVVGETQDSEAHARRGVGPAVDLPGANGTPLRPFVDTPVGETGEDAANGFWAAWSWFGRRGYWRCRYSHLPAAGVLEIGATGETTGGNVHITLWLNGERVRPEQQPEFRALFM